MANLLIVDDSLASRDALVELLGDEGYECSPAADGESALTILRSRRIDMVLLDITLPKVSGLAVLARAQTLHAFWRWRKFCAQCAAYFSEALYAWPVKLTRTWWPPPPDSWAPPHASVSSPR